MLFRSMSLKVASKAKGGWGVIDTHSSVCANENGAKKLAYGLVVAGMTTKTLAGTPG